MLATIYLIIAFFVGLLLIEGFFRQLPVLARLAGALLLGLLAFLWATFLLALLLVPMGLSLAAAALVVMVAAAGIGWRWRRLVRWRGYRLGAAELAVLAAALLFSFWLMDRGLRYDGLGGDLLVSFSTWGDFGLHVPLARSFSWGQNLPPQYPFYAGEPIRYHFGFDFLAGVLETLGLPLGWAFNLPSALGMAALLLLIVELGRALFARLLVGLTAAALTLFHSSLAFERYLEKHGNNLVTALGELWSHDSRVVYGPYDGQDIAIYWTLNVFLNQRQLILGIGLGMLVAVVLLGALRAGRVLSRGEALALGCVLGLGFALNGPVYVAMMTFSATTLLLFRRWREALYLLAPAALLALPQLWYLGQGLGGAGGPTFHLGYLVIPLTLEHFLRYWWLNLGLSLPLMLLAVVLVDGRHRRIILAVGSLFVLGNLVQLGNDLGGINHKLFNLWIILMNVYVAATLAWLWRLPYLGRVVATALFIVVTLSGVIDLMVIKNEPMLAVFGTNENAASWVGSDTAADAVFLTYPGLYQPPSLAGRRLFLGYTVYTAVAGYDVAPRLETLRAIYSARSHDEACRLLLGQGIDYVQVGPAELHPDSGLTVHEGIFAGGFAVAYQEETPFGRLAFYDVARSCRSDYSGGQD